jgi:HEAT repeats
LKERARYLMLLASLNPIPVAIGILVLLLLIALFFLQRRRAKETRRVTRKPGAAKPSTTPAVSAEAKAAMTSEAAIPVVAATGAAAAVGAGNGDQDRRIAGVAEQVKHVLSGEDYDQTVIASADPATRQLVGAELLSALAGRDETRRDRARDVFMNHGYFDDATRSLRIADSPSERAAAARRLSFVHEPEATPHLTAALEDSAPEVRRAAVEALLDQRDASAVGPLKNLMRVENSRSVPHSLIRRAIDACSTGSSEEEPSADVSPAALDSPVAQEQSEPKPAEPEPTERKPTEPEREVLEI